MMLGEVFGQLFGSKVTRLKQTRLLRLKYEETWSFRREARDQIQLLPALVELLLTRPISRTSMYVSRQPK